MNILKLNFLLYKRMYFSPIQADRKMLLPFLYLRYIQRPMARGHLWRPYPVASLQACTHTMGNCLPATSTLIPVKCLPFQPQSLHRTQWDRDHCPPLHRWEDREWSVADPRSHSSPEKPDPPRSKSHILSATSQLCSAPTSAACKALCQH